MTNENCFCGGAHFQTCCGRFLEADEVAETPEQLMRSRYSAFCLKKTDYIFTTTDPQTRVHFDWAGNKEWAEAAQFLRLEIIQSSHEGNKGQVEFKAHFSLPGKEPQVHHELSKFRRQGGVWYFREGKVL